MIEHSWLDFGSTLTGAFNVPVPGGSAKVSVVSSTWARVGRYAYLQRKDNHQVIENNVIHSNGMHQGFGSYGTAYSIWANNTVTNCGAGWFVDVGFNKDAQIINNTFVNDGEGIQLGGGYENGWLRFAITGNHFLVSQHDRAIFTNGQFHQSVISNNQILAAPGTTGGFGLCTNPSNTDNIIYSNNVVSAVLSNQVPSTAGYGFNNTTETGSRITMDGTSPLIDHAAPAAEGAPPRPPGR